MAAELNRRELLRGDADAAEDCYGQTLSIAAEQQARDLLVPAYTWFTKGFDTRPVAADRRPVALGVLDQFVGFGDPQRAAAAVPTDYAIRT